MGPRREIQKIDAFGGAERKALADKSNDKTS